MSFKKGFKKVRPIGKDDSEPRVTNQYSTFEAENNRLDPNAYTEVSPHAGQTKTAKKKKQVRTFLNGRKNIPNFSNVDTEKNPSLLSKTAKKKKTTTFMNGFKATNQTSFPDTNPLRLYPGPDQPWNISGSDKVAAAAPAFKPMEPPNVPKSSNPTLKTLATPKRVTPDLGPYGAPKGTSGVTGVANTHPFQKSFGHFGHKPRQALKSITRLKRGM